MEAFWLSLLAASILLPCFFAWRLKKRNRLLRSALDEIFNKLFNAAWQKIEAYEAPDNPDYARNKVLTGLYYTRYEILDCCLQSTYSMEKVLTAFIADEATRRFVNSLHDSGDSYPWLRLRDKAVHLVENSQTKTPLEKENENVL